MFKPTFEQGTQVELDGQKYSIEKFDTVDDLVTLTQTHGSRSRLYSSNELIQAWRDRRCKFLSSDVAAQPGTRFRAMTSDLLLLYKLNPVLRPLYQVMLEVNVGQSLNKLQRAKEICFSRFPSFKDSVESDEFDFPCDRTLLRHSLKLGTFEKHELPCATPRRSSFSEECERFYVENITRIYCTKLKRTPRFTWREINRLAVSNGYSQVSESYVRKVISRLFPIDVMISREGALKARRYFKAYKNYVIPDFPLQKVEFDAVHILTKVEYQGERFQKVIIFAALDVCTRCVVGLSFLLCRTRKDTESSPSAIECLRSIVDHPDDIGHRKTGWFGRGLPHEIVIDAGSAMNNKDIRHFCESIGVTLSVTPSEDPTAKPFIERFFNTLRSRLGYILPGYVNKRKVRGQDACEIHNDRPISFSDFRTQILSLIFEDYQCAQHNGLEGSTPNEEWLRLKSFVQSSPYENGELELFAGSTHEGVIQLRQGIEINRLFYSSRELVLLREHMIARFPRKSPKVSFRFNALDVSKIIVEVPSELVEQLERNILVVPSSRDLEIGTALADVRGIPKGSSVQVPTIPSEPMTSVDNSIKRIMNALENRPFNHESIPTQPATPVQARKLIDDFVESKKALYEKLDNGPNDESADVEPFDGDKP
ncbi:hypothetical protein CEW91_06340 [Idiomarina piscisalsi]|uniref:Integrase catalytic domain-containing protein n=1 Tax=Idiomarina piscisalsi TaxID=1096243 RepID=A0ABN5ASI4_9GAMM|nr:DDE-type integrase/transposase/recombinase [Idiomarina piscisalsi]ASG65781.1 hypothetical protein CEW91_06340 [Idiomarina piscisalsi]